MPYTSEFVSRIGDTKLEDLFEESRATPDTLYMWHVCDEINKWFGNDTRRLQDIADALNGARQDNMVRIGRKR